MGTVTETLGEDFARALATKDHDRLRALLHPELDFRAMTPKRYWEAAEPDGVLSAINVWFGEEDSIEELEALDVDAFADRQRVGYRFAVSNPDGRFVVEQQAYLAERDGRIGWMRVVCSGYRPADGSAG